ncbi:hypothetical protein DFH27DRAFT_88565 [Peziza echinospora]|nr:hypothetical protein DFH27DRAFT_88565 [Peziza echinospora]
MDSATLEFMGAEVCSLAPFRESTRPNLINTPPGPSLKLSFCRGFLFQVCSALLNRPSLENSTSLASTINSTATYLQNKPLSKVEELYEAIISQDDDHKVWTKIYELIKPIPGWPDTQKSDTAKHILDTPTLRNSGSTLSSCSTHHSVDPFLKSEIHGTVFKDIKGFESFFGHVDESMLREIAERVPGWPLKKQDGLAFEKSAKEWFKKFNGTLADITKEGVQRCFYGSGTLALGNSPDNAGRRCDIFLSRTLPKTLHRSNPWDPDSVPDPGVAADPIPRHSWRNVLVLGEFKCNSNLDCTPDIVLQLASYARQIFGAQPGRLLVHGFSISHTIMRCWQFDRSGISISEAINICEDAERFLRTILGYTTMNERQLGFDPKYLGDGEGPFSPRLDCQKPKSFCHENKLYDLCQTIHHDRSLVSRGTVCHDAIERGSRKQVIIKDSWRSASRTSEGEFWQKAQENQVWGAPELVEYWDEESISDLRKNLNMSSRVQLNLTAGVKRLAYDFELGRTAKRSRLSAGLIPPPGFHDSSLFNPLSHSKKSSEEPAKSSQKPTQSQPERIHTFLITDNIGRNITSFQTVKELLEVLRDAIICHQSLLENAGILHRDVSINNVMINKNPMEGKPKGFLIDLDLAKDINRTENTGNQHKTGTLEFMAIGVLVGLEPHSYYHDLESFYYLLIWLCIEYYRDLKPSEARPPLHSTLAAWGDFNRAADKKKVISAHEMSDFEELLSLFKEPFEIVKPLVRQLWLILPFCIPQRARPQDDMSTYKQVVDAFNQHITSYADYPVFSMVLG